MIWPLGENQGPSQLHGDVPWLLCGVGHLIIELEGP